MRANALRCIANTHREEGSDRPDGGWQQMPADRGNWVGGVNYGTKFGIAAHTAKIRGIHPREIRNLTREKADALYMAYEWPMSWGDDWPVGFDQITYDATVNSGPGRGPLWTCKALGFAKADRSAPEKARMLTTSGKVAAIKRAVSGQRMGFLRSIRSWKDFHKGWTGRCARMEAIGVKMVLESAGNSSEVIKKTLEGESKKANGNSNKSATGAGGTAAGGGGTATQADPSTWGASDWIMVIGGSFVGLVVFAWLVWMFWKHRERFKAYADAARGLIGG